MGKYLKKFENHTEYEEARQNLILPNVSLCEQENEVHYNPIVPKTLLDLAKEVLIEFGYEPKDSFNRIWITDGNGDSYGNIIALLSTSKDASVIFCNTDDEYKVIQANTTQDVITQVHTINVTDEEADYGQIRGFMNIFPIDNSDLDFFIGKTAPTP